MRRADTEHSNLSWVDNLQLVENGGTTAAVVHCRLADLLHVLGQERDPFESLLRDHGALLLRGLGIADAEAFQRLVSATGLASLNYDFASTPRSKVRAGVFSSTEYPANQAIPQHNEQSYTTSWPGRIWFHCVIAPTDRGATPLADSRQVWSRIDQAVRQEFTRRGLTYVRNFGTGLDLSWQKAFGTVDRSRIEQYCANNGILTEWIGDDHLRTRQSCQVEIGHPTTRERVWFNQAHLFHISSLHEAVRDALLSVVDEKDLPRNAYFSDGDSIPEPVLNAVRDAYSACTLVIPWQEGDVLLLDNMLMSHGRQPFSGSRQILVAMSDPYRLEPSMLNAVPTAVAARAKEVVSW